MSRRYAAALPLLTLLAGCAAPHPATTEKICPLSGMTAGREVRLLFGLTVPGGRPITQADWAGFLADTVTPAFPDGLSVIDMNGQWRDRKTGSISREPSRMVIIDGPTTADLDQKIDHIREMYKQRFSQQSVGLLMTPICYSF